MRGGWRAGLQPTGHTVLDERRTHAQFGNLARKRRRALTADLALQDIAGASARLARVGLCSVARHAAGDLLRVAGCVGAVGCDHDGAVVGGLGVDARGAIAEGPAGEEVEARRDGGGSAPGK